MGAAKFISKNGEVIFPSYMNLEAKKCLKQCTDNDPEFLWCGCSADSKLYYKFTADLKLIPVHHGYQHQGNCPKSIERRNVGYLVSDTGLSKAFLKFNPSAYTCPKLSDDTLQPVSDMTEDMADSSPKKTPSENNSVGHKTPENASKKAKKDVSLGIREFVRQINYDSFMHRQGEGKRILPSSYFLSVVLSRLKSVEINGYEGKSLRSLNLDDDKCSFFYAPLVNIDDKTASLKVRLQWYNGQETVVRDKRYFIFKDAVTVAKREYEENYGYSLEDAVLVGKTIMAAGFIVRKSAKGTYNSYTHRYYPKEYDVVGRFTLFNVNANGLFCNNDIDESIFNVLIGNSLKGFKYILPGESDLFSLNIIGKNCQGYVFPYNKPRNSNITDNSKVYTCEGILPDAAELAYWCDMLKN